MDSRPTIWLASGSPRRRDLLRWLGYEVLVRPGSFDEHWVAGEAPVDAACRLALGKCQGPAERLVVAADTVVHLGDEPFGKPRDEAAAHAMLARLAGRWHQVTTGVAARRGHHERVWAVTTRVRMRALASDEIARYVATGEPLDKAGAYGIQGIGGALVAEVEGSWTNVMGLPVESTLAVLQELA